MVGRKEVIVASRLCIYHTRYAKHVHLHYCIHQNNTTGANSVEIICRNIFKMNPFINRINILSNSTVPDRHISDAVSNNAIHLVVIYVVIHFHPICSKITDIFHMFITGCRPL